MAINMIKLKNKMDYSRLKSEELSMILIYDAITLASTGSEVDVVNLLTNYLKTPYDDLDLFIKESLVKSLKYHDIIVSDLQKNMVDWKFSRLNRLAQAILLLAVTHFRYIEKVDKKIVINNAVRLAKKYLDYGDYKLINAVLDKTL